MSTMCNLCPKYGKSAGNKRGALNEVRLYCIETVKLFSDVVYGADTSLYVCVSNVDS